MTLPFSSTADARSLGRSLALTRAWDATLDIQSLLAEFDAAAQAVIEESLPDPRRGGSRCRSRQRRTAERAWWCPRAENARA